MVAVEASALASFRSCGARVALDDFGVGNSSLGTLLRLPVDILKVDRSIVAECGSEEASASAVLETVITLASFLELMVIAEGIEQPDVVKRLTELGCDAAQGYYLGRPASADALSGRMLEPGPESLPGYDSRPATVS
jgi:EAL domain-containing protein (putative c-di-GMP-specific phosphodiesterase class I)